jgi:hypothetical protein
MAGICNTSGIQAIHTPVRLIGTMDTKKTCSTLLAFLCLGFCAIAQAPLTSQVISTAGGSDSGSFGQYDYTIGQVVQETIQFPGNIVSQGFQQPPFALRFPESAGVFCNGDSIGGPWIS